MVMWVSLAAVAATVPAASPAAAQADPDPTPTVTVQGDAPVGDIIPRPNSGRAPENPGDRGGFLQVGLLFFIIGVILAGAAYLWWQSRRLRRARGDQVGRPGSTRGA